MVLRVVIGCVSIMKIMEVVMKLSECGEEFETYAEGIAAKWTGSLFIFGAGIIGKNLYAELSAYPALIEMAFIDNDKNKVGTMYENAKIISLDEYLRFDKYNRALIVIATAHDNISTIEEQLFNMGLSHREDYYTYDEFLGEIFPIVSLYKYGKS